MQVLVVEDEDSYRRNLVRVLESAGHEVKSAANGHDAVNLPKGFRPEVLVVDWMLRNGLDGLQVIERLVETNPKLATILISGYPSRELRERATDTGVFAFIEKPFRTAELLTAIERLHDRPSP